MMSLQIHITVVSCDDVLNAETGASAMINPQVATTAASYSRPHGRTLVV